MKKEVFPSQFTKGGVQVPYTPTDEEMENCTYAEKGDITCPRKEGKRQMVAGGPMPLIDCSTCSYHPGNMPVGKESMEIKSMPNYEKMRERENESRGLPKDAHRRLLKQRK